MYFELASILKYQNLNFQGFTVFVTNENICFFPKRPIHVLIEHKCYIFLMTLKSLCKCILPRKRHDITKSICDIVKEGIT